MMGVHVRLPCTEWFWGGLCGHLCGCVLLWICIWSAIHRLARMRIEPTSCRSFSCRNAPIAPRRRRGVAVRAPVLPSTETAVKKTWHWYHRTWQIDLILKMMVTVMMKIFVFLFVMAAGPTTKLNSLVWSGAINVVLMRVRYGGCARANTQRPKCERKWFTVLKHSGESFGTARKVPQESEIQPSEQCKSLN